MTSVFIDYIRSHHNHFTVSTVSQITQDRSFTTQVRSFVEMGMAQDEALMILTEFAEVRDSRHIGTRAIHWFGCTCLPLHPFSPSHFPLLLHLLAGVPPTRLHSRPLCPRPMERLLGSIHEEYRRAIERLTPHHSVYPSEDRPGQGQYHARGGSRGGA